MKATNPWFHAAKAEREYITPEDITAARNAGAALGPLHAVVLHAINDRKAEDYRLCAFVAVDNHKTRALGGSRRKRSTSARKDTDDTR